MTDTYHILIPANVDPQALEVLGAYHALTVDAAGKLERAEVLARLPDADALIIRSGITIDEEMFAAAPKLKAVARAGVGVDNVDLEAATQHGVVVMNTPDGNTIATAEQAFTLMLSLARQTPQAHLSVLEGRWDRKAFMGTELHGKVLGIVGLGRIGRAIAKRAIAFDMTVVAYDPVIPQEIFDEAHTASLTLDQLYADADYITLHTPVLDSTRRMINAESIAKMKTGVRIINAARGALIDAEALAAAIQSGHVAGAALDVYDPEPPEGNPLIGLPQVVHTPHLGASTAEAQVAVAVDAAQQIVDGLLQQDWRNVVNPGVLG